MWFYGPTEDPSGGVSGSMDRLRGLCGFVCGSMDRPEACVAVYVVLWTDPRLVLLCMGFYGPTEDPSGNFIGSMDRPEASVVVYVVLWTDPRFVWLCMWFYGSTEDPSGDVIGSMGRY